jgi:YD repeat-containing protein
MRQIWNGKNITSQVYQNTLTQTTYASIYQSYTSDKLTGYTYNIKAGMTNFSDTVTPSYVSSGTMKEKLDTLTYSGSGRVITYGYDANHGRLNSLKYSDIDPNNPFALNYDSAGRLTSIVDPNSQTISTYSYNANNQGLLSSITYTGNKSASFTWNAKKQITNYVYTDNSTQPATTKAWEMTYYDDGRVATHTYSINDIYQYDWKYYYSPYGIDKALKYNSGQLLITIDATTAPNGRMLSLYYQDHTCQTNCFQGEASAAYDPCGNMISLVANSSGSEVWARAVDKNSNQAIGSYNPDAIEMPFVGDGTVMPPYEEPIVSPIAFTIGKGRFNVKDHLASNTDLTIAIGQNGANASIYGDDDCGDSICGGNNTPYKNCVVNCMATGDTENPDTRYNIANHSFYNNYLNLKGKFGNMLNYMVNMLVIHDEQENADILTGILIGIGIVLTAAAAIIATGPVLLIVGGAIFGAGGTANWLLSGNATADKELNEDFNLLLQNFAVDINSLLHPGEGYDCNDLQSLYEEFDDLLKLESDCKSRCAYLLKGDTDYK